MPMIVSRMNTDTGINANPLLNLFSVAVRYMNEGIKERSQKERMMHPTKNDAEYSSL